MLGTAVVLRRLGQRLGSLGGGCHSYRCSTVDFSSTGSSAQLLTGDDDLISADEVEHIANLACLDLDRAGGVESMKRELKSLLEFVAVMDKVDTTGVSAMWTPLEQDVTAAMREDVPQELGVTGPELLELAGNSRLPYYTVPKGSAQATEEG
mmetsp:Transcript_32944/g.93357  ORF Transcript_32944/g.93357 Transcript_32944/m.93357 type:complete len:152 (+) Transcript_32944:335-790(+)